MAETGFPQEKGPSDLIATSDITNPFGGNSTIDLTRLIHAAQATTIAINNLNGGLSNTGAVLANIKDAIVAGGSGSGGTVSWVTPPFSSSSAGTVGQIASDGIYFYMCVGTNFWCRVAVTTPF